MMGGDAPLTLATQGRIGSIKEIERDPDICHDFFR